MIWRLHEDPLGCCRRSHLYTYINEYLLNPTNDYKK